MPTASRLRPSPSDQKWGEARLGSLRDGGPLVNSHLAPLSLTRLWPFGSFLLRAVLQPELPQTTTVEPFGNAPPSSISPVDAVPRARCRIMAAVNQNMFDASIAADRPGGASLMLLPLNLIAQIVSNVSAPVSGFFRSCH